MGMKFGARVGLGWACALLLVAAAACTGTRAGAAAAPEAGLAPAAGGAAGETRQEPFVVRRFRPVSRGRWVGNGVAYGPHRDGQFPGGPGPSDEQLREDLRLITRRWHLIRLYNSVGTAERILRVIDADHLDLKVLLGIWVAPEQRRDAAGAVVEEHPEARTANRAELETGLRLAARYPTLVAGLCVGNETQIFWSNHRVPAELLLRTVREARARSRVPVATGDDFNFWNKPESRAVARELDFIVAHMHPLWNGYPVEGALAWTRTTYEGLVALHPDRQVVLGETGWATSKHNAGEQATLIKGEPAEGPQARFFADFNAWVDGARVPAFWFEAFDENWKGGAAADEVEKHWGLYRADRTPKPAVAGDRP